MQVPVLVPRFSNLSVTLPLPAPTSSHVNVSSEAVFEAFDQFCITLRHEVPQICRVVGAIVFVRIDVDLVLGFHMGHERRRIGHVDFI